MGEALKGLLVELEACRGEDAARQLLLGEAPHALQIPMDVHTCQELRALAEVFGCEPVHLAFMILKSALADIHSGLDEDLDSMARKAKAAAGPHCCF